MFFHAVQEEVQKDGGKSIDLVNHPYIFMVKRHLKLENNVFMNWFLDSLPYGRVWLGVLCDSVVCRKWAYIWPFWLQRWKEKFFVNVGTDCGLTIAGFYYVCFSRSDGSVNGFYYDPNSRWRFPLTVATQSCPYCFRRLHLLVIFGRISHVSGCHSICWILTDLFFSLQIRCI